MSLLMTMSLAALAQAQGPQPVGESMWIGTDDYPAAARRHDAQGRVSYRAEVDRSGRVRSCRIIRSSGTAVLDEATCNLIRERARFEPGRDAEGRAIEGVYNQTVIWALEATPIRPLEPWARITRLVVSGAGKVDNCWNEDHGPVPDAEAEPACDTVRQLPPQMLLAMRGGREQERVTVVFETRFDVDGMPGFPPVYEQQGHRLTALIESRFEIGADGRVGDCDIVDRRGSALAPIRICDHMFDGPYAVEPDADAGPRRTMAGVTMAASVEDSAAAPQAGQ